MRTIHGLGVDGGVPIGIVKYNGISSGEIDPKASGTSGEEEDEDLRPGLEVMDSVSPIFKLRRTIQAKVLVIAIRKIFLHQVDHASHLEIEQDPVTLLLELA